MTSFPVLTPAWRPLAPASGDSFAEERNEVFACVMEELAAHPNAERMAACSGLLRHLAGLAPPRSARASAM